jgi:diphthamide biosynthesis methyltransferase
LYITFFALDIKVKEQSDENLARGRKVFEPPRFMTCQQAAQQLLSAVQVRREGKETSTPERTTAEVGLEPKTDELRLEASSEVVCVARVGAADQRIVSCSLEQASTLDMGKPLHSLVIPGMSWLPCMSSVKQHLNQNRTCKTMIESCIFFCADLSQLTNLGPGYKTFFCLLMFIAYQPLFIF